MKTARPMSAATYQKTRTQLGLSCTELAAILGVTRKTISMRENGHTPVSMEASLALAQVANSMGFAWHNQARAETTTGRNEPCPCGSGRKFKKCCGQ